MGRNGAKGPTLDACAVGGGAEADDNASENDTPEEDTSGSDEDALKLPGEETAMMDVRWLSNHHVLCVAAFSFTAFVMAEICGALLGNSLSLLGDAAAMSVDTFTYFTNMWAERVKERSGAEVPPQTRMWLEVVIPGSSVVALFGVTVYVISDAVQRIIDPTQEEVDVLFLYGFAAGNLVVDVLCSWLFWLRRDSVFKEQSPPAAQRGALLEPGSPGASPSSPHALLQQMTPRHQQTNLNMMSAFTHVGGDTLRTTAVFVAALLATLTSASSTLTDAWAAIIVSVTILIVAVPLCREILKAARRLRLEIVLQADVDDEGGVEV